MKRLTVISALLLVSTYIAGAGVTVDVKSSPAEKVFALIMKQSGKNFIYRSDLLKGMRISVKAQDETLDKVLDKMFVDTDITYRIDGNNVILMTRTTPATDQAPAKATVSGFVREAVTGEPLIGAIVTSPLLKAPAVTNYAGYYSVTLPSALGSISINYPGYQSYSSGILNLSGNMVINADLEFSNQLDEVIITETINNINDMSSPFVGKFNLSNRAITSSPVIFGESDIIKTLQMQPGISAGIEGLAGMYVHGGNADENLYMLDNIPLYQVNHLGGIFSAFNTEAIKSVDFYKSSFPTRYDGRLSSFMDVHTKDGSLDSHHGSFRLGLTSAAFNIDGPIHRGTTSYSVAMRRSWLEIFTAPLFAIINSTEENDHANFRYNFTDINAKVTHRFSDRSSARVTFYYGNDYLTTHSKWREDPSCPWRDDEHYRLRWGNIMASAGWNYVISPKLFAEFTAAFTRYSSTMKHQYEFEDYIYGEPESGAKGEDNLYSDNNITDWIARADFNWNPMTGQRVDFGASYTHHSFLPVRTSRNITTAHPDAETITVTDNGTGYRANELNAYAAYDADITRNLRVNAGLHASLFAIDKKTRYGLSPRLSAVYTPADRWAVKASYSRAVQYVHQLTESYLSLPSDRWVPITGDFKPQTSDKIAAGVYHIIGKSWTASAEIYYKWMHNLIDFRDDYYLIPESPDFNAQLDTGRGTAKGIDLKLARETGRLTGHLVYSLMYADRTFPNRNGGHTYPAQFDNRHKINILLNWTINDKWEIGASWTGMSGNLITLSTQQWLTPEWDKSDYTTHFSSTSLSAPTNNFRLPFYHRLDLNFTRHTRHGFWNFSFYNAYCHMNVIGVRLAERKGHLVFQYIHLLPIIPSISYTWTF